MSILYVFAASKMEAGPVLGATGSNSGGWLGDDTPLRVGENEVTVRVTGMGPQAARLMAIQAFGLGTKGGSVRPVPGNKPDAVLVIGLCGGLTKSLRESQIVAYTKCLSAEPNQGPLNCSQSITDRLRQLLASHDISCEPAIGITVPRIAVGKSAKLILAQSGATVVDMESYEVLAAAAQARVPAAVLRVIADTLESKLPDLNRALSAQGSLDGCRALRILIGSPLRTAQLLAASKRAMRALGKALGIVLSADRFPT